MSTDTRQLFQFRFQDRFIPWIRSGRKTSTIRHAPGSVLGLRDILVQLELPDPAVHEGISRAFAKVVAVAKVYASIDIDLTTVTSVVFARASMEWIKPLPEAYRDHGRPGVATLEGYEGPHAAKDLDDALEGIYGKLDARALAEFVCIHFKVRELLPWTSPGGQAEMPL